METGDGGGPAPLPGVTVAGFVLEPTAGVVAGMAGVVIPTMSVFN